MGEKINSIVGGARREVIRCATAGSAVGATAAVDVGNSNSFIIKNVRVFDGQWVLNADSVIIENGQIAEIGNGLTGGGEVIDARGGTVLPGLIDAHTHPVDGEASLRLAALFGVTTELDMGGDWTPEARRDARANSQIADFRTTLLGMAPPGGHPSELYIGPTCGCGSGLFKNGFPSANISTPEEARDYVKRNIELGNDYIKILIEDGQVMDARLPVLDSETIDAAVTAAHGYGKMVVCHAMTQSSTDWAINSGVDGLAHLFLDGVGSGELIKKIAQSKVFIVPCLVLDRTMIGINDQEFISDPRITAKLPADLIKNVSTSFNTYPIGRLDDFLASVAALKDAGVDVLVGTDSAPYLPIARAGLPAHGASIHHELQLFVQAGFQPIEALRAATFLTAQRFELRDRGRISEGLRADLLLVAGDPTQDISSTLSIKKVWKNGIEIEGAAVV